MMDNNLDHKIQISIRENVFHDSSVESHEDRAEPSTNKNAEPFFPIHPGPSCRPVNPSEELGPIGFAGESLLSISEDDFNIAPIKDSELRHMLDRSHSVNSENNDDNCRIKSQETYGFVQLDVLSVGADRGAREWVEISRWIKYQEDLEERASRWGHPYIAPLTFNSITNLRQLIEMNGILLTDLKEDTLRGIISRVAEELEVRRIITAIEIPYLISTLLSKHKPVQEKETGWLVIKKVVRTMGANSLQSIFYEKPISKSAPTNQPEQSFSGGRQYSVDSVPLFPKSADLPVGFKDPQKNDNAIKNDDCITPEKKDDTSLRNLLATTAEASIVMVGEIGIITQPTFVFIRLIKSKVFPDITEFAIPLRFMIFVLAPMGSDFDYLEIGRSLGSLMSNNNFHMKGMTATVLSHLTTAINLFMDESITISPGNWDNYDLLSRHKIQDKHFALQNRQKRRGVKAPLVFAESFSDFNRATETPAIPSTPKPRSNLESPFVRTGRPFGGLINDVKRRYPKYKSDILDGINFQCLATVVFMYFASLAQIIPFAVLMGEKTKNMIGIAETLLPTAGAGIIFALTAGQPLLLLGTTGPLLVFDEILYKVCIEIGSEFLPTRVWISIWLVIITLVVEFFEAIVLIKWCTRFTRDIFTVLTSFLLIFEGFDSMAKTYQIHPLMPCCVETSFISGTNSIEQQNSSAPADLRGDPTMQPNTALFCTCLTLGTFSIAYGLREFKTSVYLNEKVRKQLGHFAVPIAIGVMLMVSNSVGGTYIPKMKVPKGLEPTCPEERDWLIPPTGMRQTFSPWIAIASILPAMLIFVLMFLTTDICELLIDTKERRLSKGNGFHLDMLLIAIINFGCGLFGAPWICSPPMRTIAHTDALTVYSKANPPGEKPAFLGVKEQRLTALGISTLVGCSIVMSPLLQHIPLAVLFGVFLYMGVSALNTTQLFLRINLLFIPAIHHPNVLFVKKVRTNKMHLYTIIQLGCLAALWATMSGKVLALFFPFLLMLLVPIRLQLARVFTQEELATLDDEIPLKFP